MRDPASEHLNFSSLIQQQISWIHLSYDMGAKYFHLGRMARLAETAVAVITRRDEADQSGVKDMGCQWVGVQVCVKSIFNRIKNI